MSFFESLLLLLLVAVLLLQVARRLALPYPALLAAAGVLVAMTPGAPHLEIAPHTVLALFIAPVLLDAAFDYPIGAARALLVPLLIYAVVAVLVTALGVAVLGWWMIGLPFAAALTLGAIVAPPDAAAATAVLANLPIARRVEAVLKGESLFNDATALLLFNAALLVQQRGGLDWWTGAQIALAAPGGVAFGIAYGFVLNRVTSRAGNNVGSTLIQFLNAFLTWIIAERLHLSAVLATVSSAMTIATLSHGGGSPRLRVHSYAVWTTVVFMLNVLAFLLMGLQANRIVGAMNGAALTQAAWFSAAVVGTVIVVRLVVAFGYRLYGRLSGMRAPIARAESLLVGWTGMRGLITLATAFALPENFPERDTVVLAAFSVVLATLVIQGATLGPLIRLFGIGREDEAQRELAQARAALAEAALTTLEDKPGADAADLREIYRAVSRKNDDEDARAALDRRHELALAAVMAQRDRLETLRAEQRVSGEAYLQLQEDLDWKHLSLLGDEDRRIAET